MTSEMQSAGLARGPASGGTTFAQRLVVGLYLIGGTVALMYVLIKQWVDPVTIALPEGGTAERYVVDLILLPQMALPGDLRLLLIVALMGALGAGIHAATSCADDVGKQQQERKRRWWYAMRPFIGASLALVLYFVIRGGLLQGATDSESINPYGVAAVAGLAGMFSKQATDKLSEIFRTMFRTDEGDAKRRGKLDASAPHVASIEPKSVKKGSVAPQVTVRGSNFAPLAVAWVNDGPRQTNVVDSTTLTVQLSDTDLAAAGTLRLTVRNPVGQTSPAATIAVE